MRFSTFEILHADNWCAFAISAITGCCPELAWKRLNGVSPYYNKGDNGKIAYLLHENGMTWSDINAYIGSTCSVSVCSKWKKKAGII